MRSRLLNHCDILAYCLMPNHFHMLVYTKSSGSNQRLLSLSRAFGTLLSSFTRTINQDQERTGSLFQQKTKAKELNSEDTRDQIGRTTWSRPANSDFYTLTCFHYIHQNPLKTGLVKNLEEWEFSSYPDYAGFRNGTLCNKDLAGELLDLPKDREQFREQSCDLIGDSIYKKFFE